MTTPIDLTEPVEIWTVDPPRKLSDGELFLGGYGLPMVRQFDRSPGTQYDVWSFPANWRLKPFPGHAPDMLLGAWEQIEGIRDELAAWRRERIKEQGEEGGKIRERDDIDEAKRWMEGANG